MHYLKFHYLVYSGRLACGRDLQPSAILGILKIHMSVRAIDKGGLMGQESFTGFLRTQLSLQLKNQVVGGGLTLVIFSFSYKVLSSLWKSIWRAIKEQYVTTVEIPHTSQAFIWVGHWLSSQKIVLESAKKCTLLLEEETHKVNHTFYANTEIMKAPELAFSPSAGVTHRVTFHGTHMWMCYRDGSDDRGIVGSIFSGRSSTAPNSTAKTLEITVFSMFHRRRLRKEIVRLLTEKSYEFYREKNKNRTEIYLAGEYGTWDSLGTRKSRSLSSVVLDRGLAESIQDDISSFLASEHWYIERGVPYRRGYLLYGEPGCGKTSFITALAGEFAMKICILSLTSRALSDQSLLELMNTAPRNSIILLEDIDAAFHSRTRVDDGQAITFSGLLNAIDGVAAQEGRILFMTTNHVDRLDPALIRAGRVDKKIEIGHATEFQIGKLFCKFYADEESMTEEYLREKAVQFTELVKADSYSMAKIQGHLLRYASPEAAIRNADKLEGSVSAPTSPIHSLLKVGSPLENEED